VLHILPSFLLSDYATVFMHVSKGVFQWERQ